MVVFSVDCSSAGHYPLGRINPDCVVCQSPMQKVRPDKLEAEESLCYSLHIALEKLNCGKVK